MAQRIEEDAELATVDNAEPQTPGLPEYEVRRRLLARQLHVRIGASINRFTATITVLVGLDRTVFSAPFDFLILQSGVFRNYGDPKKVFKLPSIKSTQFANFLIWLRDGTLSPNGTPAILPANHQPGLADGYEGLWIVGEQLECANFQNYCMTKILDYRANDSDWPTPLVSNFVYSCTQPKSAFRKLISTLLGQVNPMKGLYPSCPQYPAWLNVLAVCPQLSVDIICIAAGGEVQRDMFLQQMWPKDFMVPMGDLDQRWAKFILDDRDRRSLEKQAKTGCLKSIVELEHIVSLDEELGSDYDDDVNMYEESETDSEELSDEF